MPQGMSRERETLLKMYGAQVEITESMGGMNEAVEAAERHRRHARRRLHPRPVRATPPTPRSTAARPPRRSGSRPAARSTSSSPASAPAARSPAAASGSRSATRTCTSSPSSRSRRPSSPAAARPAPDPGHRRRLRAPRLQPRHRRRDRSGAPTRTRSRRPSASRATRACWPASPAARRCGRRSRSGSRPEWRGQADRRDHARLGRALRDDAVLRAVTAHALDLTGVACPMNWVRTKLALERLAPGDELTVRLDPASRSSRCRARRARTGTRSTVDGRRRHDRQAMTPVRRRARALLAPARAAGVERRGAGAAEGGDARSWSAPGALGSPAATYLAAAGVGRHRDRRRRRRRAVEPAPPAAALHARHRPPRRPRTRRSSSALLNPEVARRPVPGAARPSRTPHAIVMGADVVVDCSDSFATRYLVNDACCAQRVPLVEAGVLGFAGLVLSIRPGESACYRCALPDRAAAGQRAVVPRGRRAGRDRGHRRVDPGARGDQAADRRRRAAARPDPAARRAPRWSRRSCRRRAATDCPACGHLRRLRHNRREPCSDSEHSPASPASCART